MVFGKLPKDQELFALVMVDWPADVTEGPPILAPPELIKEKCVCTIGGFAMGSANARPDKRIARGQIAIHESVPNLVAMGNFPGSGIRVCFPKKSLAEGDLSDMLAP